MVDQLPDPPRERIFVKISLGATLVGDKVQFFVLGFVFFFGLSQVNLEGSDLTK